MALKHPVTACHLEESCLSGRKDRSKEFLKECLTCDQQPWRQQSPCCERLTPDPPRAAEGKINSYVNFWNLDLNTLFSKWSGMRNLLVTLVPGFLASCTLLGELRPRKCSLSSCQFKVNKKWFTKWNQIHPLHQGKAEKIVTYYRHITDNGEIVLRQPLARPGFEEVGRDELAEAPGIRFGLNQDGFWSLFRNSIIAIGAKMTNKLLIVCWILCVELSVNEKSMDSKKASIYRPQSSP